MKGDIFDNFSWHSAIAIDDTLDGHRRFKTKIANTKRARTAFIASPSSENLLIHKTTRALWKVSDDRKSIEPVFPTDILSAEQVEELMEDDG